MVFIGQWPFQHCVTLDKMYRDTKILCAYFVDEDKIIGQDQINLLKSKGYHHSTKYYFVSSNEIYAQIKSFIQQNVPPTVPAVQKEKMTKNESPFFKKVIDTMKDRGALAVIGNNKGSILEQIGATWNHTFSLWTLDSKHLQTIVENYEKSSGSNATLKALFNENYEVRGNVLHLIDELQKIGATYDDNKKVWIISAKHLHIIQKLIDKKEKK